MKKILVIETGGTFATESVDGKRSLSKNESPIYSYPETKKRKEKYGFEFEIKKPLYILSENMTFEQMNIIIETILDVDPNDYCGIIVTHGTDTLAYTANALSMTVGDLGVPILVVGANNPIDMDISNGRDNFSAAVDFIMTSGLNGVYVTYRNEDNIIDVNIGSRIKQMDNTFDGYPAYEYKIFGQMKDNQFIQKDDSLTAEKINQKSSKKLEKLTIDDHNILVLHPYVGLNYKNLPLDANIDAIISGVFHSGTVNTSDNESDYSFNNLVKRAGDLGIPVFLAEVVSSAEEYASVEDRKDDDNLYIIKDISMENLIIKLNMALSNYDNLRDIVEYLNKDIFFEKV